MKQLVHAMEVLNQKKKKDFYIYMNFDEVSGHTHIEELNRFTLMPGKKSYHSKKDFIASEINNILLQDPQNRILKNMMLLKALIDQRKTILNKKSFIYEIKRTIFDPYTVELIKQFSDASYDSVPNRRTSKREPSAIPYMGFKPIHYRGLYRVATGIKLILPICNHIIVNLGIDDKSNFLYDVYRSLFGVLANENLFEKLRLYVLSNVKGSGQRNRKMWGILIYEGITPETTTTDILKMILVNNLQKAEYTRDLVAFIFDIIRNQAGHRARTKFQVEYYLVGAMKDQVQSGRKAISKYNEGHLLLYRKQSKGVIDKLWRTYVTSTKDSKHYEDLYLNLCNHLIDNATYPSKTHSFFMVSQFTKDFGSSKSLKNIGNRPNLMKAMIILHIIFKKNDMPILARMVLSEKKPDRNTRIKPSQTQAMIEQNKIIPSAIEARFSYFSNASEYIYKVVNDIMKSKWIDVEALMKDEELNEASHTYHIQYTEKFQKELLDFINGL